MSCGDKISILSKASASWKTCSHMRKLAAHNSCGDKIFIVSEKCKLENLHPHGKTCSTFWRWHQQRTRLQKADQTAGKRCRNGCINCKSRGQRLRKNPRMPQADIHLEEHLIGKDSLVG